MRRAEPRGLVVNRLDGPGLQQLEAALGRHEPVTLTREAAAGGGPISAGAVVRRGLDLRWDELIPLCDAVEIDELRWLLPPAPRSGSGARRAVSVVIPASRGLPIGLGSLLRQSVEVEVILLANGPFAGEILQRAFGLPGVRVETVRWEGHGATRNLGMKLARHPYVFFSVDDAVPRGAGFLERMIDTLEQGAFEAVSARQMPWPTSDRVTRRRLRAWTPPPTQLGQQSAIAEVEQAPLVSVLDNVAALYRRDTLRADPFDAVPIAEDEAWGRRHRVGYAAEAPVLHAHPRRFWPLYQRTLALHQELVRRGHPATVPTVRALLQALPGTLNADFPGALGELLGQFGAGRAQGPGRGERRR